MVEEILTELVEHATERTHRIYGGRGGPIGNPMKTAIANAAKQIKAQQQERVEKIKAVPIFIKSVRGMMHALALDRTEIELIEDYGMLGIHNIRAVNESLAALKELEE